MNSASLIVSVQPLITAKFDPMNKYHMNHWTSTSHPTMRCLTVAEPSPFSYVPYRVDARQWHFVTKKANVLIGAIVK